MIAEILGVSSIASSVLGGGLTLMQGNEQRAILDQNAAMTRRSADVARAAGKEDARQIRYAAYKTAGQQRGAYGKAGLALSGSLLDVMADTAAQYEMDEKKALYNAELQAQGLLYEANMMESQGKMVQRNARIGAVASVLAGTVQGVASYQYGRYMTANAGSTTVSGAPLMGGNFNVTGAYAGRTQ